MCAMRIDVLTLLALAAFAGVSTPALAEWQVVRVSGAATAEQSGEAAVRLSSGTTVPENVTIKTGSNGRVMLTRGTSRIMVAPGSAVTIDEGVFGVTTTVLQRIGRVDFQVEKRDVRYFSVETPFMAAAVKGTRFSVTVTDGTTVVSVSHGLVGVTALSSGQCADIAPGQRASTRRGALSVSGTPAKPTITPGQPRAPKVRPASATEVAKEGALLEPAAMSPNSAASGMSKGGIGGKGGSKGNSAGKGGNHGHGSGGGHGRGH